MTKEVQDFSALFDELLQQQERLRSGFVSSLGSGVTAEEIRRTIGPLLGGAERIPEMIFQVYTRVSGQPKGTPAEQIQEFFPGWNLICIADLPEELAAFHACYTSEYFPRLAKFRDPFVPFPKRLLWGL